MNWGVESTSFPSCIVKLSERWCPSMERPHRPALAGVPKTVKKYRLASRIFFAFEPSRIRSSSSSCMISVDFRYPTCETAAASSRNAAACWASVMSRNCTPFRLGLGTKCHSVRVAASNGRTARAFCSASSVPIHSTADRVSASAAPLLNSAAMVTPASKPVATTPAAACASFATGIGIGCFMRSLGIGAGGQWRSRFGSRSW